MELKEEEKNTIIAKTHNFSELARLSLMESNCLPIFTYASHSLKPKTQQIEDMNIAWNSSYRKIFGFHKWESVKSFIAGLARVDFRHVRLLQCIKFAKLGIHSNNGMFRHLMNKDVVSDLRPQCSKFNIQINVSDISNTSFYRINHAVCDAYSLYCNA